MRIHVRKYAIHWVPGYGNLDLPPEKWPGPKRKPDRLPTIILQGRAVKLHSCISYKLGILEVHSYMGLESIITIYRFATFLGHTPVISTAELGHFEIETLFLWPVGNLPAVETCSFPDLAVLTSQWLDNCTFGWVRECFESTTVTMFLPIDCQTICRWPSWHVS